MTVLRIEDLTKDYGSFILNKVSFSMEKGRIMGFIGRNGAGKSTTLKAMFDHVHKDSGVVSFFGLDYTQNETKIKQRVGFVGGGIDFYGRKKLSLITDVYHSFYENWDDAAYKRYMTKFSLDESQTPLKLSQGMKVKYALTLALSHHAELLVLDEPTSGLDPVSRQDLLDVFLSLQKSGVSILFSTHITEDLEKCADDITYIKNGRIIASGDINAFKDAYAVVHAQAFTDQQQKFLIGVRQDKSGSSALIKAEDAGKLPLPCCKAALDDIMIHMERE